MSTSDAVGAREWRGRVAVLRSLTGARLSEMALRQHLRIGYFQLKVISQIVSWDGHDFRGWCGKLTNACSTVEERRFSAA
jgi:hypothetical protein